MGDSARDIATDVKSGKRKAREIVEQYLSTISEREPEIHAFNEVLSEIAISQADDVDRRVAAGEELGPLAGVPIALKDNMCTRGIATTCSSKILEGWKPPYDATVVTRLRDAGA